jgi:hypothetical protein
VRLVVRDQTRRDLDADADTLPWCEIGLAEADLATLGESLCLASRIWASAAYALVGATRPQATAAKTIRKNATTT